MQCTVAVAVLLTDFVSLVFCTLEDRWFGNGLVAHAVGFGGSGVGRLLVTARVEGGPMSIAGRDGADGDEKNGREEGGESEAHFPLEKGDFNEDKWVSVGG
jgi:hypothetical protein